MRTRLSTGLLNLMTIVVTSQICNKLIKQFKSTAKLQVCNYYQLVFPSLPFSLKKKIQLIFFSVIICTKTVFSVISVSAGQ